VVRWATHGPTGDIVDEYTTLPWAALCEEIAKVRIRLLEGTLIELPLAAAAGGERGHEPQRSDAGRCRFRPRVADPDRGHRSGETCAADLARSEPRSRAELCQSGH
jgi:hypothetical protein